MSVEDVKADHGATGDNVADDTAAIQAAIDAALPAGQVFFPDGCFRTTEKLTINSARKGFALLGEAKSVIFEADADDYDDEEVSMIRADFAGEDCIEVTDSYGFIMQRLNLRGNSTGDGTVVGSGGGISFQGAAFTADHTIQDCSLNGFGSAIRVIEDSTIGQMRVLGCYFTKNNVCLISEGDSGINGLEFCGNHLTNNRLGTTTDYTVDVAGTRIKVNDNILESRGSIDGGGHVFVRDNSEGVSVLDNFFEDPIGGQALVHLFTCRNVEVGGTDFLNVSNYLDSFLLQFCRGGLVTGLARQVGCMGIDEKLTRFNSATPFRDLLVSFAGRYTPHVRSKVEEMVGKTEVNFEGGQRNVVTREFGVDGSGRPQCTWTLTGHTFSNGEWVSVLVPAIQTSGDSVFTPRLLVQQDDNAVTTYLYGPTGNSGFDRYIPVNQPYYMLAGFQAVDSDTDLTVTAVFAPNDTPDVSIFQCDPPVVLRWNSPRDIQGWLAV